MRSSRNQPTSPSYLSSRPVTQGKTWAPTDFESLPSLQAAAMDKVAEIFNIGSSKEPRPAAGSSHFEKQSQISGLTKGWHPSEVTKSPDFTRMAARIQQVKPVALVHKAEEPDKSLVLLQQAQEEADRLLKEAREQADQILRSAQNSAAEITQNAYNQGFEQSRAELASAVEAARLIIEQASSWRTELLSESEGTVIEMVKQIAHTIFGQGLILDGQILREAFTRALSKARSLGNLRIYVNPNDAVYLDPAWRDFQLSISGQKIQVMPSDSILPGGCFIDGDQGSVDARIETGLKAILSVFDEPAPRQEEVNV